MSAPTTPPTPVERTPVLLAEINRRMLATTGTARIPLELFAAVVETDRPLAEAPAKPADDIEQAIARHVAELIDDGDTLQMGVGSLPSWSWTAWPGRRAVRLGHC
ncbi:hypothetical protein ILP97_41885 [Amycolatopsis sp. H6(2020)]|nr:hypothetical protein [Amycolatopsis sp. H6(2020)]